MRRQSEGVTPPIDQRPSSFLLSFLQFVNFLNRGVDFGRAAAAQHLRLGKVFFTIFFVVVVVVLGHPECPSVSERTPESLAEP